MHQTNIPAILHWVWIGEQPSSLHLKCQRSFASLHQDFQLITHRYKTVDDTLPLFTEFGLGAFHPKLKEYRGKHSLEAVFTDFVRLMILLNHGGITLDYDLFCLRPIHRFLLDDVLLCRLNPLAVSEAIIGARKNDPRIMDILNKAVKRARPSQGDACINLFLASLRLNLPVYDADYFMPHERLDDDNRKYRTTKNTYAIHLWKEKEYSFDQLAALRQSFAQQGN